MSLRSLLEDPIISDLLSSKKLRYALIGQIGNELCMLGASKGYRQKIGFNASNQLLDKRYGRIICDSWAGSLATEQGWTGHIRIEEQWHKVQIWAHGQFGLLFERPLRQEEIKAPANNSTPAPAANKEEPESAGTSHAGLGSVLMQLDNKGRIIRINQHLSTFLNQQLDDLKEVDAGHLVFRSDMGQYKRMINAVRYQAETVDGSFRLRNTSNEVLSFDWTASSDGNQITLIGKSSQQYLEQALVKSEERINNILESMNDAFFAIDDQGFIAYINGKGAELLGKNAQGLLGRLLWDRAPELKKTPLFAHLNKSRGQNQPESFQWEDITSNKWYQVKTYPSEDLISVFFSDISDIKLTEHSARHQATHDSLTGLPNRLALKQALNELMQEEQVMHLTMGLLFIDLDGFKGVNDTLGHNAGDELLKQVAQRLTKVVRSSDIVARLSGDEFVITLPFINDVEDAYTVGKKVVEQISQTPFELGERRVYIGASVGVALYPNDSKEVEGLMKNADIAMYDAKQSGKNTVRVFHQDMSSDLHAKMNLEYDLHEAIREARVEVHYQPRFNRTGNVVGAEALVRLRSPDGEMISPADFIPLAEETGLIVPLGRQVMQLACEWLKALNSQLEKPISVSVNVSGIQLFTGELPETVASVLEQTGVPASQLELELTETILMQNEDRVIADLEALHGMGVSLSVDDFGTGYSSLSLLQKMPVQTIKLDRSFVIGLPDKHDNIVISRTVSALAKSMGLGTVAEGVETEEQRAFLIAEGFDELQGFGLSRPLPAPQASQFILNNAKIDCPV